ncbi:DUF5665 domain-containing protein [Paenibacillus thailandensis]|jgi:hypothetical protein|uniref:DUF5665 domain-containing protein n=1 Tax=Paenibacillus thailandensis TaxID=393250 RepID=A0ABW5QXI4_9BACL
MDNAKSKQDELAGSLSALESRLQKIAIDLERSKMSEYVELLNHPWKLIWRSIVSGLARGFGIAVGITIFSATIVLMLQKLGALNLPIIGDYIADIVRIVQTQLEGKAY